MLILQLEVQSTLVRGSLVWDKPGEQPEIVFTDERSVPYRPGITTGHFVQTTMKALGELVDAVLMALHDAREKRAHERFPAGSTRRIMSYPRRGSSFRLARSRSTLENRRASPRTKSTSSLRPSEPSSCR